MPRQREAPAWCTRGAGVTGDIGQDLVEKGLEVLELIGRQRRGQRGIDLHGI